MYTPIDATLKELDAIDRRMNALPVAGPELVPLRLLYWLRMLTGVASGLSGAIAGAVRARPADPGAPRVDAARVCWLLGRAMRWLRVLRGRATVAAARHGRQPDRRDDDDYNERLLIVSRPRRAAAPPKPAADGGPGGRSADAIAAQICADLTEAARLLGQTGTVAEIAAIAEALRVLLTGAAAAAAGQVTAASAATDGAAAMPPARWIAPDTG